MPTLDWLNREAAFRSADAVPTRVLRELLSEDGSIWVTLDDTEAHYFKVMVDEVFARGCFIADIAWKRRDGAPNDRRMTCAAACQWRR